MEGRRIAFLAGGMALAFGACVGDDSTAPNDGGPDTSTSDAAIDALGSDVVQSDASDGGGPWTPAVLDQAGELALWLESSSSNIVTVTNAVGQWKDRSQNHNDANCSNNCPIVDTAVVNGLDAIRFEQKSGVVDINPSSSLDFGVDDVYIAAVAATTAPSGHGVLYQNAQYGSCNGSCPYVYGLRFWVNGDPVDAGGTGVSLTTQLDTVNEADWTDPVFDDGKFHRVAMRRAGGGFSLYQSVDDAVPRAYSTGQKDLTLDASVISIGGWEPALGILPAVHLDLAELIIVHAKGAPVPDQTVLDVQKYLKSKYAL